MALRFFPISSLALCLLALSAFSQESSARQRTAGADMKAFLGTWQLDTSRTKLGSVPVTYEQVGDRLRATTLRGTYTFKIDGNEYPTALKGETITWRQVDKNTIETTSKQDGKVQSVATRVFSPDGKTIMVTANLTRDTPTTVTFRMERQSDPTGNHPLVGTWKQRLIENSSPVTRRVTYTALPNGLHVRYEGGRGEEYDLVFDDKQHAVPTAGADLTARRIDDRTIEERWTRDGIVFSTSTITVSPDGQDLTERSQPPDAHSEPSISVYRRTK